MLGNVHVLRQTAQHGSFGHAILCPERGPFFDNHATFQNAIRTYGRIRLDHAIGSNLDIWPDLGQRTDNGKRMYAHGRHLVISVALEG